MAIGSRFSRDRVLLNYPLTKILASRIFHILAWVPLWKDLRDVTHDLELMKQEVARNLPLGVG